MSSNLNELKFSKYNHKINLNNDLFLYNALSGRFYKANEDTKKTLKDIDLSGDAKQIECLSQDIIKELKKGGFLVGKDINEFNYLKAKHNISRFNENNSLGLTLVPTMACNFRCTYCFEKDKEYPNKKMTEEVMDATINLIDERLREGGKLVISWFGGEPLLEFDIFRKLQGRINEIVEKKKLNLFGRIVTNGYLLTKERSDELLNMGISTVQITIDGSKEIHDSKRTLKNGLGTFDKIIENILDINENLQVGIRVNIEKDNIKSIPSFLDYLNECGIGDMKNVSTYFAVVRDYDTPTNQISNKCYSIKEFSKEEIELNKMAYEKGINISNRIKPNLLACGALSPSTFVIEPDGTIQKCWNSVGDKSEMVGHLIKNDFELNLTTKNKSKWHAWSKFESEECKDCNVLPLCMGGCPYYTIEDNNLDKKVEYKCITQKYNLEETLKLIAYKHINKSKELAKC